MLCLRLPFPKQERRTSTLLLALSLLVFPRNPHGHLLVVYHFGRRNQRGRNSLNPTHQGRKATQTYLPPRSAQFFTFPSITSTPSSPIVGGSYKCTPSPHCSMDRVWIRTNLMGWEQCSHIGPSAEKVPELRVNFSHCHLETFNAFIFLCLVSEV